MIEDFGTRVGALRKEKGMSQGQLAEKLGVSRQAVSKWESGKAYPDIYNLVYIAGIFEVTTDYLLLGEETEEKPLPPLERNRQTKKLPVIGIFLGAGILCCMPLLANIYQMIQFSVFHICYTDAGNYMLEWPLLGITVIGLSLLVGSLLLLVWRFAGRQPSQSSKKEPR